MNKYASRLADMSQDIAGPIPVGIVEAWLASDQSPEAHTAILAPFRRQGTIVSSDASGLSRLAAGRSLVEVMKLVSEPKEIIHAYGKAIGGRAVGIWAADNTQMFFDQSIDVNVVVRQMVSAQRAIEAVLVDVGIGLHQGTCFEVGGGLYGADADAIEDFTENATNGKEVVVSNSLKLGLREPFNRFKEQRRDMFVLDYAALGTEAAAAADPYYPAPFDREFHADLRNLDVGMVADVEALHARRVVARTIVLLRIFHDQEALLLNQFMGQVAANIFIREICRDSRANIVKSNGTLAIIACTDASVAVGIAMALQARAMEEGFAANTGVSEGEVLIFDLGQERQDIAGGPVNVASKLAEDTDDRNRIFFEGRVAEYARQQGAHTAFDVEKAGIHITGLTMAW